jgi:acyl-CoA thioester hydrolase
MTDGIYRVAAKVEPEWVDYNGHLNMAYYHVMFDRALDRALDHFAVGPGYAPKSPWTVFTAEVHVRYLAEVLPAARLRVDILALAVDDKRLHTFQTLCDAETGRLHATSEQMLLHVGLETRKVSPFPADARARLEAWVAACAAAPRPEGIGRAIAMPKR